MTNVFGGGAPVISTVIGADTGPLQLAHAFAVSAPCVVTHIRYYVADPGMNAHNPALPYRLWLQGDPDSVVTGSVPIPASVGWVTHELSPHLTVPPDRRFAAAVSLPAGTISYGAAYQQLPASNKLLAATAAGYLYTGTPFNPYENLAAWDVFTSYLIDVEVAMSEMVNLAPDDLAEGDLIQVRRTITGTVNPGGITPITDAYTVNVAVHGGPLDGEDIDVWVPDTANGLAAADMQLLKELPDPDIGSRWQSSDGALWVYQGGAVYDCFIGGTVFSEGAKTSRADTPSLTDWAP